MSKILFFDIDGTIVDHGHGLKEPTNIFKRTIKSLQDDGHLCFISSGRCYGYISKEITDLGFDGYVLNNGANVLYNHEYLFSVPFPIKKLLDIIQLCAKTHSEYSLCDGATAYCPIEFDMTIKKLMSYGVPREEIHNDYELRLLNITKIEVTCPTKEAGLYFKDLVNEGYEVIEYPDLQYFEIGMPSVSKANAILKLAKHVGINIADTIAFGDGDNDYDMIYIVGHGVAMGNAKPIIKEIADSVTQTVLEDGITHELVRLGLVDTSIFQ